MDKQKMTIQELIEDALDSLYQAAGKNTLSESPDRKITRATANAVEAIKSVAIVGEKESTI